MKTASVIELFAGCGGMSSGLLQAGYNVRVGIDNNAASTDTYDYNHKHVGASSWQCDVRTVSGDQIRERAGLGARRPDLLTGGPPCQPFSIVGKRLALEDDRGDLILQYLRVLKALEPKAFIFENVANFARIGDGEVAGMLMSRMEKAGYALSFGVLNVAEFGVPQMRKRFFIVGVRGRRAIGLPERTHGPLALLNQKAIVTCSDALDDLPDVDTIEALRFRNHEGTCHSPAMTRMFEELQQGTRDPKSHHDRLHPDRPSYTLRAGNGNFTPLRPIHHRYNRVISVRESARLQGFADSFVWPDDMSRLQQYRQVGNAVPPPMAALIGTHIAERLGLSLDPEQFGKHNTRTDRMVELSVDERIERRRHFIRGASTGRA